MNKVKIYESKTIIPTYPEPAAEEMPMFAENRVHQRSSGRPYPNKVVMEVDRTHKEDKEYKLVTLENEYVKIEILPEIKNERITSLSVYTDALVWGLSDIIKNALTGCKFTYDDVAQKLSGVLEEKMTIDISELLCKTNSPTN